MKFAKIIGGGLGWVLGGPIGGIIGFALGSVLDNSKIQFGNGADRLDEATPTTEDDFAVVLIVLSAAVMKADGKVLKSELAFVKAYFQKQFGEKEAVQHIELLRDVLDQNFSLRQVCLQIRANTSHPMRLQLLHYLFGIAAADGTVDENEVLVIRRIGNYLGIGHPDFRSIQAMFAAYGSTSGGSSYSGRSAGRGRSKSASTNDYTILEITSAATNDEVKKAYRKMARKYHPDKVAQLGENVQLAAKEKFQKVQQAYENICKTRGMN